MLNNQSCSQYSTSQVPVPVLKFQIPVWVPLLEIHIVFILKTAKVEVSNALLLKSEWIIIDKRSKLAHCILARLLHIRTISFESSVCPCGFRMIIMMPRWLNTRSTGELEADTFSALAAVAVAVYQSINHFYLLKMSRDTHKRLFNYEQDNKAETSTNSCPTNKLYYERKEKTQRVQNILRWRAHTLYQVLSEVNNSN